MPFIKETESPPEPLELAAIASSPVPSRARRIDTLDGFRALAIMLVIAFHYTITFALPHDSLAHIPVVSPFSGFIVFELGWLGVEFFFIISGFVIFLTLGKCSGFFDFARRRVARIWPALLVSAALTTFVVNTIGPPDWSITTLDWVTSILLIDPKFAALAGSRNVVKWVDPVYWSLAVEIRFYLIAGIVFFLGKIFLRYWVILQFVIGVGTILVLRLPDKMQQIWSMVTLYKYLPYFTFGICIYELWRGYSDRRWAYAGLLLASLLITSSAIYSTGIFAEVDPFTATLATVAMLSMFLIFLIKDEWLAPFRWRPIVALGQASYSLYLVHSCIGVSIINLCVSRAAPFTLSILIALSASLMLAFVLRKFVEIPGGKLIMGKHDWKKSPR